MQIEDSPAFNLVRALRLLDPELSGLRTFPGQGEAEILGEELLKLGAAAEPRNARNIAVEVLARDDHPLDGLFRLAERLIDFRDGIPHAADSALWHRVGRHLETDLIIAARLARRGSDVRHRTLGDAVAMVSWPSILATRSFVVEQVVTRELVDTHVHLGGVLPGSFFWTATMSGFAYLYRLADWSPQSPDLWIDRVIAAREWRDDWINHEWSPSHRVSRGNPFSLWGDRIDEEAFVDPLLKYICPHAGTRARYNPALGERYFLCWNLTDYFHGPDKPDFAKELLSYLRTRNSFIRHLAHHPDARGLERFKSTFRRQHLIFPDRMRGERRSEARKRRARRAVLKLERFRARHALRYQFSDPTDPPWARDYGGGLDPEPRENSRWRPPRQIEMRVTPVLSNLQVRVLFAYLQGLADFLRLDRDASPLRLGLVFHVHRGSDVEWVREVSGWQIEGLLEILEFVPELRPFVVGIDAAGEEMLTGPRDLSHCFRAVRERVRQQDPRPGHAPVHLGRTCHSGEDFRDLLTGLRYVDETVALFRLEPGERIGHGLALAVDPDGWYGEGGTYPRLTDHLLDLLWARCLARKTEPEIGLEADYDLDQLLELHLDRLCSAHRLEPHLGRHRKPTGPSFKRMVIDRFDELLEYPTESHLLRVYGLIHSDRLAYVKVDRQWVEIVRKVQRRVRRRIEHAEVVVEVCPTSNMLIGGFLSYERLPYLNLCAAPLEDRPGESHIQISINSDDPGVFQTTVANEFRLLGQALVEAGHPRQQVAAWLEQARKVGVASTFIPPWSPPTRAEILYALGKLDPELKRRP